MNTLLLTMMIQDVSIRIPPGGGGGVIVKLS